jgi:hypothetical protein
MPPGTLLHESALHDDVGTRPHRRHGLIDLRGVDPAAGNLDERDTWSPEALDELPLVRESALDQGLQDGIPNLRLLHRAACDRGIESSQMTAVEMADEVGGAEAEVVADLLHVVKSFIEVVPTARCPPRSAWALPMCPTLQTTPRLPQAPAMSDTTSPGVWLLRLGR